MDSIEANASLLLCRELLPIHGEEMQGQTGSGPVLLVVARVLRDPETEQFARGHVDPI